MLSPGPRTPSRQRDTDPDGGQKPLQEEVGAEVGWMGWVPGSRDQEQQGQWTMMLEHFHYPSTTVTHLHSLPLAMFLSPLVSTILLSIFLDLLFLDLSYKYNHIIHSPRNILDGEVERACSVMSGAL